MLAIPLKFHALFYHFLWSNDLNEAQGQSASAQKVAGLFPVASI
jgi:hypothetical protein